MSSASITLASTPAGPVLDAVSAPTGQRTLNADVLPLTHCGCMALSKAGSSTVAFPSVQELPPQQARQRTSAQRPFLPFRRISLPAAPSIRDSLGSIQSFGSTPEEPTLSTQPQSAAPSSSSSPTPFTPPLKQGSGARKSRPVSMQGASRTQMRRRRTETTLGEEKTGKRVKVMNELLETERSYVQGLDLIYEHFLTPLIDSLDTPQPLLTRNELNSIFVNFIDIWNYHHAFFTSLSSADLDAPLAPLLSEHFPYLSLYTPFITAFPDSIAALSTLLTSKPAFATFLKARQADPQCKMLSLRDWLLSVVQRCPRYLLLLKDLISCTEPSTEEYEGLFAVHALVSKITLSLNTSLHSHTQTLTLLAIQRSTPNLPFPLISPGRTLLKRGNLLRVEREQRLREFLLLSDCLIWLSKGGEREWEWGSSRPSNTSAGMKASSPNVPPATPEAQYGSPRNARPPMGPRQRSKSDAELPAQRSMTNSELPEPNGEEKWLFRGKYDLMDMEVITSTVPGPGEERRFDLFGPVESFAVYASNEAERDAWVQAIRSAKSSLLMSLNMTHPNSTLTSSASTTHLRRTLQAFPHHPETLKTSSSTSLDKQGPSLACVAEDRLACFDADITVGYVEGSFAQAVRARQVLVSFLIVLANALKERSQKTFFISEVEDTKSARAARACNDCYESIFPILPSSPNLPSTQSLRTGPSVMQQAGPQSIIRPSAMHMPTLPDIPSYRSLAPEAIEGSPRSPAIRFSGVGGLNRYSFPTTSSSLPSSMPSTLPPATFGIPTKMIPGTEIGDPPELARLSCGTVDTTVSTPTPPMAEHPHQFTLPIPIVHASEPGAPITDHMSSGSPPNGDVRRRSRSSLPALRDSFYKQGGEDLPSDVPGPSHAQVQSQSSANLATRSRRISFAPSSAVHKAPVTIYPQNDETTRFSLVLTGKGTVGRGAGLDVGRGGRTDNESRSSVISSGAAITSRIDGRTESKRKGSKGMMTPLQSTESLLSTTTRSRRSIFDGLETGVAVGKLKKLLGRGKSSGNSVLASPK
ncbi:hypothetical protein FRB97_004307 [Tulasnella sp. 331]|nr:hypothetical protein FRB97_004307 [Tulasnella sp. 331]KAG8880736.1 hypothetical protein FRB98_004753 [Tulasnella sp. 332]